MIKNLRIFGVISLFCAFQPVGAQNKLNSFVEYGATVHAGDNNALWQVSNVHGVSSLDNNTYVRGGVFYKNAVRNWSFDTGVDLIAGVGMSKAFYVQQAFADVRYKWIGLWAGSRELPSEMLNQSLSSGGLSWSGNAHPIPQVAIGILDYVHLAPKVQFKIKMSFGWFTDGRYQQKHYKYIDAFSSYVKKAKYHHKSFFFLFGDTERGNWLFELGMNLEDQFGGYKYGGPYQGDLGNGWKDYWKALIPQAGGDDAPIGDQLQYQGNLLGSEHFRLTYQNKKMALSAYFENYFDDFSSMGKLNGADGLYGLEYKSKTPAAISGIVLEYYRSMNQSGPLHGKEFSDAKLTWGADDYYNNFAYPGWSHWGMGMGTPLNPSPVYNKNGALTFLYNRVKAVHLGWCGSVTPTCTYRAKLSFSRSWGTPFKPLLDIAENFSAFVEFVYMPQRIKGWSFIGSIAGDTGDIYGDNLGFQIRIKKVF